MNKSFNVTKESLTLKTIFFLLVFIPLSIYVVCKLWGNCCFVDYTSNIQKMTEPLHNKLAEFIKENRRNPDLKEQKKLLNTVGCLDLEENHRYPELRYNCMFSGRTFSVVFDDQGVNGFDTRVMYGTSMCDARIDKMGRLEKEEDCFKVNCIEIYH